MREIFFHSNFPTFNLTDDVILRDIRVSDAVEYFRYMNNENVAKYIATSSLPTSVSHAIEELRYWGSLFASKRSIYWAIALKETNKLIGTAGYNNIWHVHSRAELSYDLDFDYWGKGIMTKALKAILEFSQKNIGLVRVQATALPSNAKSVRLLENLGFSLEGVLKKYEYLHNQFHDSCMYSKILQNI